MLKLFNTSDIPPDASLPLSSELNDLIFEYLQNNKIVLFYINWSEDYFNEFTNKATNYYKEYKTEIIANFSKSKPDLNRQIIFCTNKLLYLIKLLQADLIIYFGIDNLIGRPFYDAQLQALKNLTEIHNRYLSESGVMYIMTKQPENQLFSAINNSGNLNKWYQQEIELRNKFNFPPFGHQIKFLTKNLLSPVSIKNIYPKADLQTINTELGAGYIINSPEIPDNLEKLFNTWSIYVDPVE